MRQLGTELTVLLLLFVGLELRQFARADGCNFIHCKNGTVDHCEKYKRVFTGVSLATMYTEQYKDEEGCRRSYCCDASSTEAQTFRRGPGCITTKCIDPQILNNQDSNQTMCDLLDLRKAKRQMNLLFESVYDEPCSSKSKLGKRAICCQPGHPEKFLTVGYAAEKYEFPHLVRLSSGCGGTIYNERWVITAAHCVVEDGIAKNSSKILVKTGTNIESNVQIGQLYEVSEVRVHPKYSGLLVNQNKTPSDGTPRERIKFDLAVLKLKRNIDFGPTVKALPIASEDFEPLEFGHQAIVIGWGKADNYRSPQLLRKAFAPMREITVCETVWANPPHRFYSEHALCVGGIVKDADGSLNHGVVAGQGDSGGPAICRDARGFAVLCGVTSYGSSDAACEQRRDEVGCLPNVFSRISYFNKWIVENAGSQTNAVVKHVQFSAQTTKFEQKYLHQIQMKSSEGKSCGGTLIKEDIVVTAAHCVYASFDEDESPNYTNGLKMHKNLYISIITNSKGTPKETKIKIKRNLSPTKWRSRFRVGNKLALFTSPYRKQDFKILDNYFYEYDIALLKLEKAVENAQILELVPKQVDLSEDGIKTTEVAWNFRGAVDEGFDQFEIRDATLLPVDECQRRFSAFNLRVMDENATDFQSPEWNIKIERPTRNNTLRKSNTKEVSLVDNHLDSSNDKDKIKDTNWVLNQIHFKKFRSGSNTQAQKKQNPNKSDKSDGSTTTKSNSSSASATEVVNWLKENVKDFELSERELCYVEKYSGGTTCNRQVGGGVICKDKTGKSYLCGVQVFRLCFGSFPNIAIDVRHFRDDIEQIIS